MPSPIEMLVLADIKEVISIVMALLVPILWAVKQIADAAKQGQEADAARPAAPRPAAPQAPVQAAGQQADPLRNQVEEFLRRAGRAPQANRVGPAPRDIEVLIDEEPARRRPLGEPLRPFESRSAAGPKSPAASTPVAPQSPSERPVRRSVVPRKRKTLAERAVERAEARASKLAEQSSHLGQRIIAEDQQFDVQLKAKFDHTVGTLAGSAVPAAEQVPVDTPASQIAAMLASPDGMRQAIVVNEILRRPTDRWES
ncbi:MAG: hypothetical protein WD738_08215 [Pirellulales bacterium]